MSIHKDIHTKIKLHATYRNMSMTKYVLQAVTEQIAKEEKIRGN